MPATIRRTSTVWGSEGPPAVATRPRRGGGAERTRVRDVVRGGSSSSSKKDKSVVSSGCPESRDAAVSWPVRPFQDDTGVGGNGARAPNRGLMETTDELPTEVAAPLVLGRYRLGDRLGAGGFGTVYAATDERLERAVAVKVIPSGPAPRPERGRARGAGRGPARPSRGSSRSSTPARTTARAIWSPSSSTGAPSTSCAPRACSRTATSCGSASHSAVRSSTPTAAASCTATSSRRT